MPTGNLQVIINAIDQKIENSKIETVNHVNFSEQEITFMSQIQQKWKAKFNNIGFCGRDARMLEFFRSNDFKELCKQKELLEKIFIVEAKQKPYPTGYIEMLSSDRTVTLGSILRFGLKATESTDWLEIGTENASHGLAIDGTKSKEREELDQERRARYLENTAPALQNLAIALGVQDEFNKSEPKPDYSENLLGRWENIEKFLLESIDINDKDILNDKILYVPNYTPGSMADQAHWWMRDTFGGTDTGGSKNINLQHTAIIPETVTEQCTLNVNNVDDFVQKILNEHLLLDEWFGHMVTDRAHLIALMYADYPEYIGVDGSKFKMRDAISKLCKEVQDNKGKYPLEYEQLMVRLSKVEGDLERKTKDYVKKFDRSFLSKDRHLEQVAQTRADQEAQQELQKQYHTDKHKLEFEEHTEIQSLFDLANLEMQKIQEKEQHKQLICSQEAVKQDTLAPYINGLDCIDVTGDGNCFYYAVAAAFNVQNKELLQCSNQTLRQQVAEYIENLDDPIVSALFIADKKEELQQEIYHLQSTIQALEQSGDIEIAEQRIQKLTKEITDLDNPETNVALYASHKEAYINDIIEGKKWADGLAINALSKALDRTIVVMGQHKTDGEELEPRIIHAFDVQSDNSPIFIDFNGTDHYRALIVQPGYDGKKILEREKAKAAPSLQTHSDKPLTPEPTKSRLDKVSKQLYSVEVESYFNSKHIKTKLSNIIYQPILPAGSTNKDIIGEIRSTDTGTTAKVKPNTVLASIHKDSIKCPIVSDDKTYGQLIDVQQEIFLEFLKFQSNKASKEDPITIEANNFSHKDLSVLLDLLNQESPKLFINLQLPSSAEECRYGNNKQYTPQEFDNIKIKIEQYNKSNQDPASSDESRHHPGPKSH